MKLMKRNKRKFSFALLQEKIDIKDTDGNYTGEAILAYSEAVSPKANYTPARGESTTELFGNLQDYDRVIVVDDMDCPIDENSVIWIGKDVGDAELYVPLAPEESLDPEDDLYPEAGGYLYEDYNYVVKHVARGLYSIAYAISKVDEHVQ